MEKLKLEQKSRLDNGNICTLRNLTAFFDKFELMALGDSHSPLNRFIL